MFKKTNKRWIDEATRSKVPERNFRGRETPHSSSKLVRAIIDNFDVVCLVNALRFPRNLELDNAVLLFNKLLSISFCIVVFFCSHNNS